MTAVRVNVAARELGISARRVRQLARLHPRCIVSERPLRVRVDELRAIRGATVAALASAAMRVIEMQWPKLQEQYQTPEVFAVLLIAELRPELQFATTYPEPLQRLRVRAGLPAEPEK